MVLDQVRLVEGTLDDIGIGADLGGPRGFGRALPR